jgi:endonuclease/exonuclease/phosphatase family metal-dependent hydrolase
MRSLLTGLVAGFFLVSAAPAQIFMSGGTYAQNFDSLTNSGNPNWTNNVTLPGWYASKGVSPGTVTNYTVGTGSGNGGGLYSFGDSGGSDRALGSVSSSGPGNLAYGVRLVNDTAAAQTNFTISFTGEQWRDASGSGAVTNTLAFSYQISGSPLTNADAANSQTWVAFTALDFNSPTVNVGGSGAALNGNAATNRQIFANVLLPGVGVAVGQEIFFRWRDVNDAGNDAGMAVDDLTISFANAALLVTNAPVITLQPQNQAASEGGFAILTVAATGSPAPNFQWRFNGTNLPGANSATLTLNNLTTNQAGNYSVVITNLAGATNSGTAQLIVMPASLLATNGAIKILTYNVAGNNSGADANAALWNTNATQVQAIGRELMYWQPDIITFNEIPATNGWVQMPDWMKAFLPGYFLATNSTSDGFIQNVIASRFPITRSTSWLKFSDLTPFGYTSSKFTRDLFEAQITVPNWPLPLHVFVAHLKSTGTSNPQDDADKRAAMASAVLNYFATVFLVGTNATHPYVLDGDMNEDAFFPDTDYVSGQPIQRMASPPTGLQMTVPANPFTHADLTESIQGSIDTRFDYILPCGLLFSNIAGAQVFRTDLLTNFPSNLFSNDDKIASDHLPVLMVFNNPFDTPFKLVSVARTNQSVTLQWESQNNRAFNLEASSNLINWTPFVTNLQTSTTNSPFVFATNNVADRLKFFRVYRVP